MVEQNEGCVAVIGGGLAGLTAAIVLARSGKLSGGEILLFAPEGGPQDGRTTALMADSIRFLEEYGIWQEAAPHAWPLRVMRIIDDTGRLVRAPQSDFTSAEIGLEAFGYNIMNSDFLAAADRIIAGLPAIRRIGEKVTAITRTPGGYAIDAGGHSHACGFLIGADGRNSIVRQSLGIGVREWQYPQVAVVGNFAHTLPHHDISTEFHTPTGPTTLVPLGPDRSSLVCVVDRATAERLRAMDGPALDMELERRMHSVLGKVRMLTALQSYPLSGMMASSFGKEGAVLVGEAAHVFPPIGAQGFNLGIRDVEAVVRRYGETLRPGDAAQAYNRDRLADIASRTAAVDMLNRSLLSTFLPVQIVRSLGLVALGSIAPLRRLFMREGVKPGGGFTSSLRASGREIPSR